MKVSKAQRFEARARILRALGNPNRLLILDELSTGEKCVAELTEAVGLDMSTISKHLSVLKSVGLVKDERRATQVFYSLLAPCVLSFFNCVESVMEAQVQHQIQLVK
ncbi:ArsR/SmtB family transcription factor [Dethiosulfatarculus sandiegensis]|uniref:ArsR family transcriptional regulator n=1 Tax=Dethiosulfatarculus sandiegensis TaxID=1429043 RepID=A0A0D2HRD0_9BACT|nr:metalloregulator ArsR/SmtB family transcription factor [Dethiosulfatarculus sandiegensis]KIX13113.1 ArsR family transcriptional regulator [Dethiosulfatarculus sandiegensis]